MSDEHAGGLAAAVLAVQAEAPTLLKDSTAKAGSFSYKYVDLKDVVDAVRPLLVKNGLVWQTFPTRDELGPALRYRLTHAPTGECDQDTMPLMLQKADPQGQGSGITYARRYALIAVLDLVADVDDDGAKASQANAAKKTVTDVQEKTATAADVQEMKAAAQGLPADRVKLALAACGVEGVTGYGQVPAEKVPALVKALAGVAR